MPDRQRYFATCAPGHEALLQAEMRALGLARVERQTGGVAFEGGLADARRANLELRTAGRVLLRVARFAAPDADALYAGAAQVDWRRFLGPEGTLRVDANARESALAHGLFVEQRVKDAIVDRLRSADGRRPSVDKDEPDLIVYAHLFRDRCTLLADTSGAPLYKRGWRVHQGRAPLAETLAAALVLHSGWDRRAPLLDPFSGSGTIVIEAALLAADLAPGLLRERFGFERWPFHDAQAWQREREAARARVRPPRKLVLRGSDASAAAVEAARENARAAGVDAWTTFEVADVEAFAPRRGWNAWVVSNLPYGHRVGDPRDVAPLHRRFGAILRERCAGFRVALLCGDERLARELALPRPVLEAWRNGALDCTVVAAEVS